MLCPWLHYQLRTAGCNDVAGTLAIVASRESVDVVAMAMRCHHGVQLAVASLGNILCNSQQQPRFPRAACAAEIDQHVPVPRRVMKRQQEAVSESDVINTQRQFGWLAIDCHRFLHRYRSRRVWRAEFNILLRT